MLRGAPTYWKLRYSASASTSIIRSNRSSVSSDRSSDANASVFSVQPRIIKRLLAKRVARKNKLAGLGVERGEREHAVHFANDLGPPQSESLDEHFRVRSRPESASLAFKPGADVPVIVNLAVEAQLPPAVAAVERLRGGVDVSMMLSRRWERAQRAYSSTQTPEPSGPRCAMTFAIFSANSRRSP